MQIIDLEKVLEIKKDDEGYFIVFKEDGEEINNSKLQEKINEGFELRYYDKVVSSCKEILLKHFNKNASKKFDAGIRK